MLCSGLNVIICYRCWKETFFDPKNIRQLFGALHSAEEIKRSRNSHIVEPCQEKVFLTLGFVMPSQCSTFTVMSVTLCCRKVVAVMIKCTELLCHYLCLRYQIRTLYQHQSMSVSMFRSLPEPVMDTDMEHILWEQQPTAGNKDELLQLMDNTRSVRRSIT